MLLNAAPLQLHDKYLETHLAQLRLACSDVCTCTLPDTRNRMHAWILCTYDTPARFMPSIGGEIKSYYALTTLVKLRERGYAKKHMHIHMLFFFFFILNTQVRTCHNAGASAAFHFELTLSFGEIYCHSLADSRPSQTSNIPRLFFKPSPYLMVGCHCCAVRVYPALQPCVHWCNIIFFVLLIFITNQQHESS